MLRSFLLVKQFNLFFLLFHGANIKQLVFINKKFERFFLLFFQICKKAYLCSLIVVLEHPKQPLLTNRLKD